MLKVNCTWYTIKPRYCAIESSDWNSYVGRTTYRRFCIQLHIMGLGKIHTTGWSTNVATHITKRIWYICKSVLGNKYIIKHVRNVHLHFVGTRWRTAAYCNTDLSQWYWRRYTLPVSSNFFINRMTGLVWHWSLQIFNFKRILYSLVRHCSIITFNNERTFFVRKFHSRTCWSLRVLPTQ